MEYSGSVIPPGYWSCNHTPTLPWGLPPLPPVHHDGLNQLNVIRYPLLCGILLYERRMSLDFFADRFSGGGVASIRHKRHRKHHDHDEVKTVALLQTKAETECLPGNPGALAAMAVTLIALPPGHSSSPLPPGKLAAILAPDCCAQPCRYCL